MNLSARIGKGRIDYDKGSGFRANPADYDMNVETADRGSFRSEQDPSFSNGQPVMTSANPSMPHSSSGFRRALERTERTSSRLTGDIASRKNFGGKGFQKPNYFGQGVRRHGLHIGTGAPATVPATDTGAEFGT